MAWISGPIYIMAMLSGLPNGVDPDQIARTGKDLTAALENAIQPSEAHRVWNPITKAWLSTDQMMLLAMAYEVGKENDNSELLQALVLQESMAGRLGRVGNKAAPPLRRAYGVAQMKVIAAKDVFRRHPDALGSYTSDWDVIDRLLQDNRFALRLASYHLADLKLIIEERAKEELTAEELEDRVLAAYHLGLKGARALQEPSEHDYVQNTRWYHKDVVEPFNVAAW